MVTGEDLANMGRIINNCVRLETADWRLGTVGDILKTQTKDKKVLNVNEVLQNYLIN